MLTIVLLHPEMMCVARLISFSHEQMKAEKAAKEAASLAQQKKAEEKEAKASNAEITQATPEAQ